MPSSSSASSRISSRAPSSSNSNSTRRRSASGGGKQQPTTPNHRQDDEQQPQSVTSSRSARSSRASSAAVDAPPSGGPFSTSQEGIHDNNKRSHSNSSTPHNKSSHSNSSTPHNKSDNDDDVPPPPATRKTLPVNDDNRENASSAASPQPSSKGGSRPPTSSSSRTSNNPRHRTPTPKEEMDTTPVAAVAVSRTHSSVSSVSPIVDSADDEKDDDSNTDVDNAVKKKNPKVSLTSVKSNDADKKSSRSVSKEPSPAAVSPSRTSALATTKKKVSTVVTTAANVAALRPPPKRTTIGTKTTTTTATTANRRMAGGGSMGTSSRWGANNNNNRRAISGSSTTTTTTATSPSSHFPTKIVMAVNAANRSRPSRRYREGITSKVAAGILTSNQLKVRINHLERQEGRARNETLVKKEKQEMIAIQRWVDVSMAYVTQVRNGLLDRRMVRGPAPLVIFVGDDTDDEKLRGTLPRVNRPVGKSPIPHIEGEDTDAVVYKGAGAWHQYRHNTNLQKRTAGAAVARERFNVRDAVVLAQGGPATSFLRGGRKDMDRSKSVPIRKPQPPPPRQPAKTTTTTNTSVRSKSGPAALDASARSRSTTTTTVTKKAVPKASLPRKNSIANHRHQRMLLQQREGLGGQEFMKRNQVENEERASIKALVSECFPEFILDVDFVDFTRYVQHRRAWADELKTHRARVLESSVVPLYPLPQIPLAVYQGLARFEGLHGHTTADAVEKAVAMVESGKPTTTSTSTTTSSSRIPLQETVLERLQLILAYAQYRYRRRMTSIANKREPSHDGDTSSSGGDYDLDVTSVGSSAYGSRASSAVGSDTSAGDNSPKHHRRHRRRRSSGQAVAKKRKSITKRAGAAADVVLQSNAKAPALPVRRYRGRLPIEEPTMPVAARRRSLTTASSRSPSRGPTPRKHSLPEIQPFGCLTDSPAAALATAVSPPVSASSSTTRIRRVSLPEELSELVVEPTGAIFTKDAPQQPPPTTDKEEVPPIDDTNSEDEEEDGSPLPRRPRRHESGSPHGHSPPQIKSATVSPSRNVSHSKSQPTATTTTTHTSAVPPAATKGGRKLISHNQTNEKVVAKSTFFSRIVSTTAPPPKKAPPAPPKRSPARKAISPSPTSSDKKENSTKKDVEEVPPPPPPPPPTEEEVPAVKQHDTPKEEAAVVPPPPPVAAAASINQTPITTARSSRRQSMQSSILPTTPSSSRSSSRRPRSSSSSRRSSSRRARSSSRSSSRRRSSSVASSRAVSSARSSSQPTTAPSRVTPSAGHSPPTSANRQHRRRNGGDREEVTVINAPLPAGPRSSVPRGRYEEDLVIETTVFANTSPDGNHVDDDDIVDEDEYYQPTQRKGSNTVASNPKKGKGKVAAAGGGLTSYGDAAGGKRGSSGSSEEGRQRHPAGFTSFSNDRALSKTPTPPTSSRDGRRGRPGAVGSGPAPLVSAPVVRQR